MFTGLIEDVGKVVSLRRGSAAARLTVETGLPRLGVGESIAVNGVCQTVVESSDGLFSCDVLKETLRVTNIGLLGPRSAVNLERAMRPVDRMGGHIMNGHVDGLGVISAVTRRPLVIDISVSPDIFRYIVPKGSVAVDGISLTVGPRPERGRFRVHIIPHTWESTNLVEARAGRKVNIEVDILAKYVEGFLRG